MSAEFFFDSYRSFDDYNLRQRSAVTALRQVYQTLLEAMFLAPAATEKAEEALATDRAMELEK